MLWLPDLDAWDDAAADPPALVGAVDRAYVDGTFFDEDELPGRDRGRIAHPTMSDTLKLARAWPDTLRARLRFIHLNHSNPALWPDTPAREFVTAAGCGVAEEGETWAL
jgi:pyrroloquinoline quinone biosynthesis protein B